MAQADEAAAAALLQGRVDALETSLRQQDAEHSAELRKCQGEIQDLQKVLADLEAQVAKNSVVSCESGADFFTRRVAWTIGDFARKESAMDRGESIWSPKFRAAGLEGWNLEFFPKGQKKTTLEGFCSLFLWGPSGTKLKYQLWVGSFLRAPDEDEYTGKQGHGHSNFCPLAPEVNREADIVTVGVDLLDVRLQTEATVGGLRLISTSLEALVAREAQVLQNRGVERVVWKIPRISEHLRQLPRGASMWSQRFTAAGIREILLEFYPNGSTNTTKDGYCAFYIRCPEGVSMIVTLFVGRVKKGPIKTTFDTIAGKGLPDFCPVQGEIHAADDTLEVGIELVNQPSKTLHIET